uniref:Uncharacterized protein n=1 Tax=Knipowitschia caucasica TaxID=637954 RepID=A0AAV2KEC3_KNICA
MEVCLACGPGSGSSKRTRGARVVQRRRTRLTRGCTGLRKREARQRCGGGTAGTNPLPSDGKTLAFPN